VLPRIITRTKIRDSAGMTILELVIIVAILLILALLAGRTLFRARLSASETSAVSSLRIIAAAQIHYSVACGSNGFAPSLGRLALPPRGSTEGFLDPDLAQEPVAVKSGYRFEMRPGLRAQRASLDCHIQPTQTTFYSSAARVTDASGTRSFAINQSAEIWAVGGRMPPQEPFARPAWVLK
jgi:type II secretory pathway pseudopilin PulG